jgi:hypothetical protein
MGKLISLSLPEFAFLDGFSHEGNSLEHRTVLLHVRTHTVIECLMSDDLIQVTMNGVHKSFIYFNRLNYPESHTLMVHHSYLDAPKSEQIEILNHAWKWYEKYLEWEDGNIDDIDSSTEN